MSGLLPAEYFKTGLEKGMCGLAQEISKGEGGGLGKS